MLCGVLALPATGQRGRAVTTPLSLSYMLPRGGFRVEVTAECTELVPGPFHEYAERQLGTRPAITSPGESWRVKSIRVIPVAVADEREVYTLTTSGEYGALLLNLTPEGFLAGVGQATGTPVEERPVEYTAPSSWSPGEIEYARFGIESTLKEVLDSNFSTMEIDGVERRVWDPIERHVLKGKEEYVQEITNELFATRRKRLDALTSPGGITGESIEESRAIEEAYLSLFLGKRVTREVTRAFFYTPERAGETTLLFRFAERQGFTGRENVTGIPYLIEVTDAVVPGEKTPENAPARPGGIAYRVPAVATLRVLGGERALVEERCVVPQLGYLKYFPLDVINSEGLSIEFYPLHGSIKNVTRGR